MTTPVDNNQAGKYVVIGADGRVVRVWNPETEKWDYQRDYWRSVGRWVAKHEIRALAALIIGAVVWTYILHCVYEMTPFLQWLDVEYPIIFMSLVAVIGLAPLYLVDYIHRLKRGANASKV